MRQCGLCQYGLWMLSLFAVVVSSNATAAESLLREVPNEAMINEIISLRPKTGHHFNLKAKLSCGEKEFLSRTPMELRCQLQEVGETTIVASICDDAVTFCKVETHQVHVKAPAGGQKNAQKKTSVPTNSAKYAGKNKELEGPPGFITNDPQLALQKAKAQVGKDSKKTALLLIDFYGIWCPPCNMLDEYVFHQPSFIDATQEIVKVRLDADAEVSWQWKEHFRVGGYPTLIIANQELQEIDRLVGYEPLENVVAWVQESRRQSLEPVDLAKEWLDGNDASKKTDERYFRVGKWLAERRETEAALRYLDLAQRPDARKEILELRFHDAIKKGDKAEQIKLLQQFLDEFPDDIEFAASVVELHELDKNLAAKYIPAAIKNLDYWKESPSLVKTGWSIAGVYGAEGDFYTAINQDGKGQLEKAKLAYSRAADEYAAMSTKSNLAVARGTNLERLTYLRKADRLSEAKKLAEQLVSTYGEEFTFNYNYARLLYRLKEYKKATHYTERALANAYGDNYLYATDLLMQIFIDEKKFEQAAAALQRALDTVVLPASGHIRTHDTVARLRRMLREAQPQEKKAAGV